MNKSVKRYYDLAYDYHLSATILWMKIIDAPYIYNPTIFLLRHTAELLLKGLIINESILLNPTIDISLINIQDGAKQRKINEVHSLYNLWENFKHLNRSNRLVPCYSSNQEQAIDRVILFFNDKDFNSTTFRYPFSKQGKPIIIEPIDLNNADKAPELGVTPPTIIQCGDNVCVIKKGIRYISQTQKLFEAIELLFQFYGK